MSDTLTRVTNVLVQEFGIEWTPELGTNFEDDLDFDPLHKLQLSIALEEHFNIDIPDTIMERAETVEDVVTAIDRLRGS